MTLVVKNLGQVSAIVFGATAPDNTKLIWYDTANRLHKVYDKNSSTWVQMSNNISTRYPFTFTSADLDEKFVLTISHGLKSSVVDVRIFNPRGGREIGLVYKNVDENHVEVYFAGDIDAGTWSGVVTI